MCKKIITIAAITISLLACQPTNKTQEKIQIIDVEAGIQNKKEMPLSAIADSMDYVKLETLPICLIGNGTPLIRGNRVFVMTHRPDCIYIFNQSGNFLSKIDRQGKGPGEYDRIDQWTVSPSGNQVVISCRFELYLYKTNGEFINKTSATANLNSGMNFHAEDEVIICTNQLVHQNSDYPAVLKYSNKLKDRDTILIRNWEFGEMKTVFHSYYVLFYRYNGLYYYKEQACDTLFQISTDGSFSPRFVFKSGSKAMSPEAFFSNNTENVYSLELFAETRDYFTFTVRYKGNTTLLYYHKSTGDLFSKPDVVQPSGNRNQLAELKNDLDGFDSRFDKIDHEANTWVGFHQIADLKQLEKEGFFERPEVVNSPHGKQLRDLVKSSSADDNPIVRILYLKKDG
jgi:hypothetical protein